MDKSNSVLGMDVSDRAVQLCEVAGDGEVVFEGKIAATEKGFRAFFQNRLYLRVVLETGTHSPWMSRLLTELGHDVVVADSRRLAAISSSNRKNDRNDAEMLARLGRADVELLNPVAHRTPEAQAVLARLRARDALVGARTKLVNVARGVVKPFGYRFPKGDARAFGRRGREGVPEDLAAIVGPLLDQVEQLSIQIDAYDHDLEQIADASYPTTQVLRRVKGVGPVTSLAFVVTIENPARFESLRDVGPWLGLTPKQDQSGSGDKQLRITKAGDHYMRRLLVNSAHYILGPFGPDTDLRRRGLAIAERGGKNAKKRAAVAVARKLAVVLLSLWRSGEVYQPLRQAEQHPRRPRHPDPSGVAAP